MTLSQSAWSQKDETFSYKDACKEFDLTKDQIITAIKAGKLNFKQGYADGNPYVRLLRKEIIVLAKEIHGEHGVELKKIEFEIKKVTRELNSHEVKISVLKKKQVKLILQREVHHIAECCSENNF